LIDDTVQVHVDEFYQDCVQWWRGNRFGPEKRKLFEMQENMMSQIVKKGNRTVVKPRGDIVASTAEVFSEKLRSLVEEGIKELIIDLSAVDMVDSCGLRALLTTYHDLCKAGGKLSVTHVSKDIYDLFKAMQLDQHFPVSRS
jgi:anti-sigma B factor antagonist